MDALVSIVVEKFADFLIDEVSSLGEVRSEVESLKGTLSVLLGFIKDAEDKQDDSEGIRQWLSQIREIAYDCEDFLDEFKFKFHDMATVNAGKTSGRTRRLLTSVKKGFHKITKAPEQMFKLHGAGKRIEALKKRLDHIFNLGNGLGLKEDIINRREAESRAVRDFKERRKTTSFEREKNVIGHEEVTKMLLGKLLDNETGRVAISIRGTGGLGKTTLARKLFHNDLVKYKFRHFAWVCVSQDYNIEDLLRGIISSFNFRTERLEMSGEEALKTYLRTSLEGSSYLVVIDDVWRKDDWERLMEAFPNEKHGSRVIMTTRNRDVADCADHVHPLRYLSEEESWQLFCAKTSGKANATKEMEQLGRDMVKKCGGLPLAIVLLGGLLSEKSAHEWRLVRNHIWQSLNRAYDHIKLLFHLSFNDLYSYSSQLKLCFLYLGHYPEDFEISTDELIRLWVAEGFIPRKEERMDDEGYSYLMEDVGYSYLEELVKRSLIQIDKTRRGRILSCRVHDILRNVAIEKAEELNLFQIYEENKGSTWSSTSRRQVVYSGIESYLQLPQSKALRSLWLFHSRKNYLLTACSRFRHLRVLNLPFPGYIEVTKEIGKLIHLKYFGVWSFDRYISIGSYPFPRSILNFLSLQTLILPRTPPAAGILPIEICKLQELRHVIGRFEGYYRMDSLKNLQTLKEISFLAWIKVNPEGLVNLRELHIFNNNDCIDPIKELSFDSMAQLKSLQILRVGMKSGEMPSLQPLSECKSLVELGLVGRIRKLPEEMPENLGYLELRRNKFEDDPMPILEKLPSLTVLILEVQFTDLARKHVVSEGGFPVLEILVVVGLGGTRKQFEVKQLEVAEGAMPQLKSFRSTSTIRIPERLKIIAQPARFNDNTRILEDTLD